MDDNVLQPWQKPIYHSFGVIRLHEEIRDFCNYIKPTLLEKKVRDLIVEKVKKVIIKRWPSANVDIFGSFATGLYLPTSDIDIVVFGNFESSPLWTVEKLLRENSIGTDIKVIEKALVPIVKFIDKESGIQVDISFNKDNGVKAIPVINGYVKKYPHLKELFLILKQFMLQRDLNEVFTGGMGSYCLMLMCISFMQHHNINSISEMNIGCLLIEFFELYGRCFNFLNTTISVSRDGCYKTKFCGNDSYQKKDRISIEDPLDKDNDVARSCYGLFNIRAAFANAYCKLHSKVVPSCISGNNNGSKAVDHDESILGSIISVSEATVKYRNQTRTQFASLVNNNPSMMDFGTPSKSFALYQDNEPRKQKREKRKSKKDFSKIAPKRTKHYCK